MEGTDARELGVYRGLCFQAGQVDPVTIDADLLIVGMPGIGGKVGPGAENCTLDRALQGTLSHLRAGGLFDGVFGETLVLARPPAPVRCASLLIVGMGDAAVVGPAQLGLLASLSMRAALQLDCCSAACLLSLPVSDPPPDRIDQAAQAMMAGVLRVMDAYPDPARFAGMHWLFDLRLSDLGLGDSVRADPAFAHALRNWPG